MRKQTILSDRTSSVVRTISEQLPEIRLLGNQKCSIENHRGILRFTSKQIEIKTSQGAFYLEGEQLTMPSFNKEEIQIRGKIVQVRYEV